MSGTIWVCEHGHVDYLHRSSALDICCTCYDGVCEPKPASASSLTWHGDSKVRRKANRARRERAAELRGATPTKPRRSWDHLELRTPVETARLDGDCALCQAGILTGLSTVVYTAELGLVHSLCAERYPAFPLTEEQRRALNADESPRIAFPATPTPDHPEDRPWPAKVGDVVLISETLAIVVTGISETVTGFKPEQAVQYRKRDMSSLLLDRSGAYTTSAAAAMTLQQAPAEGDPTIKFSGQFRPEREPETVDRKWVSEQMNAERQERVDEIRAQVTKTKRLLDAAEERGASSEVRFAFKRAVVGLEKEQARVEALQSTPKAA